ncbi:MAG: CDP-archaeol synthase [Chloroflexi bacterium]|nr:CDP-archaeol synthase [Chloroflexota bacterium]
MTSTTPRTFLDQNMRLRILTAVVAIPIALGLIIFSWATTALLIMALLAGATYEYVRLVQHEPSSMLNNVLFGVAYLGVPLIMALWLRHQPDGVKWFMLTLITTWVTDSMALFVGKAIGKHKLAPRISPKKTWEGFFGGVISGFVLVLVLALVFDLSIDGAMILLAVLLPIAAVLGDLLESKLKRRFNVKDSGTLFPGHGGILDRIDSVIATLLVTALVVILFR